MYLRLWREHDRKTLEQIGDRINPPVAKGTVSRWEEAPPGKLTPGVVAAYAEALGRHFLEMYRKPDEGPSLDVIAAPLDEKMRGQVIGYIEGLKKRSS